MPGQRGNPGGGRKSAYQEKADAEKLFDAFFGIVDQKEIESRIQSGRFSIWDRVVLTALEGDGRILQSLINRAFPEKLEHSGQVAIVPIEIVRGKENNNTPSDPV